MLPTWKLLSIVSVVSFCSNWQFGYQITYINTAASEFYNLSAQIYSAANGGQPLHAADWSPQWSAIISAFYAGALIGFILVPYLIRKVGGVRNALLVSSLPAIFGCLVQLGMRLSPNNVFFDLLLSFGRLLVGVQAGCSLCLLPLFIIETSAIECRPFLSSLQQVFQALATLIGLVSGSNSILGMGHQKLEWLQIIGLLPTLVFAIFLLWLPETPFRLLEKCQTLDEHTEVEDLELAFEHSALFYYGPNADFNAIRDEAFDRWRMPEPGKGQRRRPLADNWKGLLIGTAAAVSFAFTADDLVDSYSAEFLSRSLALSEDSSQLLTAMLGILLFLTSIFGAFLADHFERRRLLISGLTGTALSNAAAALGAATGSALMTIVGFALTKAFVGFGAGAPCWYLTSELVSPLFVAQAQAISTGSLLVITGLCTLAFLPLQELLGSAGALVLLSSLPALLVAIFLFAMLPETRNMPFERVRYVLSRNRFPGLAISLPGGLVQLAPLLEPSPAGWDQAGGPWEKSWELPHRAQRLMSASSYVSYGSVRSNPPSPSCFPRAARIPNFRRHSDQHHHRLAPNSRSVGHFSPTGGAASSTTFSEEITGGGPNGGMGR